MAKKQRSTWKEQRGEGVQRGTEEDNWSGDVGMSELLRATWSNLEWVHIFIRVNVEVREYHDTLETQEMALLKMGKLHTLLLLSD